MVLLSGGMDSTTLLYHALELTRHVRAVSFNYGQRHSKELQAAFEITNRVGVVHHKVDLRTLRTELIMSGSSLLDPTIDVPEGHYAADNMAITVVPNRNAIMLSIAFGIAVAIGFDTVMFAPHSGDHEIYPDCRADFVQAFEDAMVLANRPHHVELVTPFIRMTKADIAKRGNQLGVPFDLTWSCYKGGAIHCGRCGTCVERMEAFAIAKVEDPTVYEDTKYWTTVIG